MSVVASIELKGLKRYVDRHGRPRTYLRANGEALPEPGTEGFMAAYEAAIARAAAGVSNAAKPKNLRFMPGAIGWCIEKLAGSTQYRDTRADSTRLGDKRYFDIIRDELGAALMRDLTTKNVKRLRNALKETMKPSVVDEVLNRLSIVWNYADEFLDLDLADGNPTHGVKRLHVLDEDNERKPWTPEVFAAFDAAAPGSLRVAVALLLYTGQRTSDAVAMRWDQYDGECITVPKQKKTGEFVIIPCHRELKAILDQLPRKGEYILTGERKDRLQADSLQIMIRRTLATAGCAGFSSHGLRKNAVQALLEAGAQPIEVMAITGHRSLQMLMHYAKRADKKRLGRAAMDRWEANGNDPRMRSVTSKG